MQRVAWQLAKLLGAGIPLAEALEAVRAEGAPKTADTLGRVLPLLEAGYPLAEALAAIGWGKEAVSFVAIAERTGDYAGALNRLAERLARRIAIRRRLLGQLAYPAFLFALVLAFAVSAHAYFLPRIAGLAEAVVQENPAAARLYAFDATLLGVLVAGTLVAVLPAVALRTGDPRLLSCAVRLPFAGTALRAAATVRTLEPLAALLEAGYDVDRALAKLLDLSPPPYAASLYLHVRTRLKEGARISDALARIPWLDGRWRTYVRLGERTGELPYALGAYVAFLEEDLEERLGRIAASAQPFALILATAFAASLLLRILLPLTAALASF
ncbi:type II secretion system F family protein [Brockia lithotrophica]|uniref:type II secretion system F family protein n=1 Tax=Brockia lithotrophica TaxID=933949 RepID=UPI0014742C30|nr:type II secretion system F family protein [Brockia lithotrophica]